VDGPLVIQRPMRWDNPFSEDMTEEDVERILKIPPFSEMNEKDFPPSASLRDIIRNDTRIQRYKSGDIVVRKGDYGNSAFMIMTGALRVVISPDLPSEMLGRQTATRRGFYDSLKQLWQNAVMPEVRAYTGGTANIPMGQRGAGDSAHVFLQDVPGIIDKHNTVKLEEGTFFGEIAALGRTPRGASLFAEDDCELIEIRWQGLRDIRRRDDAFRNHIDKLYRERSLGGHLRALPMFKNLSEEDLKKVADATVFETHGEYEWHTSFKKFAELSPQERLRREPVIASEGDYVDGLILIRSSFCRVSRKINHGNPTAAYLGKGETFGFGELVHNWKNDDQVPYQFTLRGLGNVDILRVPTPIMEEIVLPTLSESEFPPPLTVLDDSIQTIKDITSNQDIDPGLLEFLVENRTINGSATMLIDTNRCVRCDDCTRACAATHNNNPRFVRHGRTYSNIMVANACMHCTDPVCMIGCPTGAIHRSSLEGQVVVNDATCIGCATCANSCPYNNIRMVEVRDANGRFIRDENNAPIVKSTKCDLCVDQMGGPSCERACPHNALRRADMSNLKPIAEWLNNS